jgi:hypothetical protein
MDMDRLDATQAADGARSRAPPTLRDNVVPLLSGGTMVALAAFYDQAMKALQYDG